MNTDALKYQIDNSNQALTVSPLSYADYVRRQRSLHIEPVEGGFIVSGDGGGFAQRAVATSVPALVRILRSWCVEVTPKKDA